MLSFRLVIVLPSLRRLELNKTTDGYTPCEIRPYFRKQLIIAALSLTISLVQRNARSGTVAAIFDADQRG
jgi:hypothetical protein